MTRGRPPKPTRLKLIEGNPGGRKINDNEPVYPALALNDVPNFLNEDARNIWHQLGAQLVRMGLLQTVDSNLFARYCDMFARWCAMSRFLNDQVDEIENPCGIRYAVKRRVSVQGPNGKWMPVLNSDGTQAEEVKYYKTLPEISMYHKLGDSLVKLETELGLTPVARSKLSVPNSFGRFGDVEDPFA